MLKIQLNQNLTLNYGESSLPSSTTFNEFAQMVLEKLYPKQINLRDYTDWVATYGTYTDTPLMITSEFVQGIGYYAELSTVDYFDFSNSNIDRLSVQSSATGAYYDNIDYTCIELYDRQGTRVYQGRINASADLSAYTGEYKVVVKTRYASSNFTTTFQQFLLD